ncbi:hypothetical protein [Campylobacter geochelonis]|uniref:hypothetical protein n=1 Tax=Campylobacter geochelonis TaxID=1780362 RepID=UPI00094DCCC4|nr:hypothetical protein [Campylobacter geochelonis]
MQKPNLWYFWIKFRAFFLFGLIEKWQNYIFVLFVKLQRIVISRANCFVFMGFKVSNFAPAKNN